MTLVIASGNLSANEITALFLGLAVLLGGARILGEIARKLGQPAVIGEILAGVVLGQTFLGRYPQVFGFLFPSTGGAPAALSGMVTVAVALLLLVAGLEVDLSTVWRQGKAAVLVSLTGIAIPFVLGFGTAMLAADALGKDASAPPLPFALFIGIAMSITALPVIAKTLMDLNMLKSDMGMLIMSAAMVDDLVGWMGFATMLALLKGDSGNAQTTMLLTGALVVLMLTVGRMVFHRVLPAIQRHTSWPGGVMGFIFVVALLCAGFTEHIGIHAIFGAFIAGVAMGDSPHLRERTRDTIHQFVTSFFAPIFFAYLGLHLNFIESFNPVTVVVVLALAIVCKVGGCYLGASWAGLSRNESWAVGFGMSARGAMEIVLGQIARQAGIINDELFVAIVIMALVTSLMSGPMMKRLLRKDKPGRLVERLTARHMAPGLKAATAREAIRELSGHAAQLVEVRADAIDHAAWQREQDLPTGVGQGLAVPHARLAELHQGLVIVGTSQQGIDFNAPDGQPAHIICLIVTPLSNQTEQIELLALAAETFINDQTRLRALAAKTSEELLAALRDEV